MLKLFRGTGVLLSLFHFNVLYVAGDEEATERYCQEAINPFLDTLWENPWLRVSFEIAGVGLEYLRDKHNSMLDRLRRLVQRGQVELISSLYTPSLWVAFPLRDLRRSVQLNRETLLELEFEAAPIFFAQEAFFGAGVAQISDLFSVAICKDDYLLGLGIEFDTCRTVYEVGGMGVLVAGGHVLHWPQICGRDAFARYVRAAKGNRPLGEECSETGPPLWKWLHCGSGHHLTVAAEPYSLAGFTFNPDWTSANVSYLRSLLNSGGRFGHIMEAVAERPAKYPLNENLLIEGSWNYRNSQGIYAWMGRDREPWEDDATILGSCWRAREVLVLLEREMTRNSPRLSPSEIPISHLWKLQLLAEASDPLGWRPSKIEVEYGKKASAAAWLEAKAAYNSLGISIEENVAEGETYAIHDDGGHSLGALIEFLGAEGTISSRLRLQGGLEIDINFIAVAEEAGVRFRREAGPVRYSPAGRERECMTVPLEALPLPSVFLPLANGLIGLGKGSYLIRVNICGQPAAEVDRRTQWITFKVACFEPRRAYNWRFILIRADEQRAIDYACELNHV